MTVQDSPQNSHDNNPRFWSAGFSILNVAISWIWENGINIARADCDRTRTQRDALAAFFVRVTSAGILYLSQIALARLMGGFEYGVYVFVWTWVMVLGGLSHLGFSTAMIRLIPEYKETGETGLLRGLLRGGRLFSVSVSTAVMLTGMLILYLLGERVSSVYVMPVYLALVCVPMFTLSDVQDGIGRANAWMGVALVPPYILRPLMVLVAMFSFYALGFPMEAKTAAGAAIIASWIAALTQTLLLNRRLTETIPAGRRDYAFSSWIKTSLPLIAITGCEIVLQNTDVLVISRYMSPTDVGIYFAAAKTMALIMFVHYAVGSAVANRFAALHTRGDKERLRDFVSDAVNWTFWPSLVAAIIILALGKPLLWLFGPQFMSGYPVMFILVMGFLVRSAMGPAEFLLNMMGQQRACALNLILTAALNIILNLLLVPRFGLTGAAVATATALVTVAVLNYIVARKRLGLDIAIWQNLKW